MSLIDDIKRDRNHAENDLRFAMEQEKRDRERKDRLRRQFDEEDGA